MKGVLAERRFGVVCRAEPAPTANRARVLTLVRVGHCGLVVLIQAPPFRRALTLHDNPEHLG
jgi:hypothetical protein